MDRERLRLAGYAVAAVLAVVIGARFLAGGDSGSAAGGVSVEPASRGGGREGYAQPRRGSSAVLVQVAGEVNHPGVYRLSGGARVNEAVERAGGLTPHAEQAGVNLVARVQDGQQIVVPRKGATPVGAGAGGAGGSGGAASGPVSLSSATAAQLESLDGIGPALAKRIVDYRQAHGGFRSIDELRQVQGIGEKRFAALKKSISP